VKVVAAAPYPMWTPALQLLAVYRQSRGTMEGNGENGGSGGGQHFFKGGQQCGAV
jgi:hypothetical protein